MIVDVNLMNGLVDSILKIQKKNISNELNNTNIEFYREGFVKTINQDGTVNVQLANILLENLQNLSGMSLNINQKVKVFYNNKNMSGCYIGTAF